MDRYLENIEHKAAVLCDALPYIRDFVHKVIVIEYDCGEWLSGMEEKKMIKDIVLLKSIGVIPIVVHRTQMGVDKFRENKRIAKLLELYDTKAIGICGVDIETIQMMIKNDYIPVIVPNDIDNEMEHIDPRDTALEVAVKMQADKLIYVYPRITVDEVEELKKTRHFQPDFMDYLQHCIDAVNQGVNRAHILDGRIEHVLPIEFFSIDGAGTVLIKDEKTLYQHEL